MELASSSLDVTAGQGAVPMNTETDGSAEKYTIETRFGAFEFDKTHEIEMPQGILGFADHRSFGLCYPEDGRFGKFALLQSLTDGSLSFIVLPIMPAGGGLIEDKDIADAASTLGLSMDNLAVLLITTIRKGQDGGVALTVNTQAPVLIDAEKRRGFQYVMHNARYSTQFRLDQGQ